MTEEVPPSSSSPKKGEGQVRQLSEARSDLSQSEERFRLLVESVSDYAIFLLDPKGYVQSWNSGAERFKGYTAEEIIGKHFSIFYPAEEQARRHPEHELEVATEVGRFEEEGWRIRKDGTRFWANVVITRLKDSTGKLVGFAKVTRDLTRRRAAEEELRISEERYRLLVSSVRDYAIFMLDPKGIITTWNEGAQRLKGYLPSEIIGRHFSTFYVDEDIRIRKPEWELEEAAVTGRFEDEGWRKRKDGTLFWANVVLSAIRDPQGKLLGYSKVTRDITDRRRLEEKLRRANEDLDQRVQERTAQLESAIRARDEFISIVSHELRTPVTSLKLQAQTALRQLNKNDPTAFNEKTTKFVSGAGRQLDRLAKLIDDMLDVSRISMAQLTIDMETIELGDLVRDVVERFEEQAKVAGSKITVADDGGVRVQGDRLRLEQVLNNLITNALKYGQGTPIEVSLSRAGGKAFLSVQDHGMGIAPGDHGRIFERFERAVSANSISGMGIGLFVSQKIIEAHRGTITVESEPGRGSLFTVTLPALG
jgi:PAS domain S-box-containing protein